MTEIPQSQPSRLLSPEQSLSLYQDLVSSTALEPWKEAAEENQVAVEQLIRGGIDMIQGFEKDTYQKHPDIHTDTDIVYIDSGPGPYSYNLLTPGKTDLDDFQYHKWPWTRKMDRARIKAAYTLTSMITAKRIQEQTGVTKPTSELTSEDFEKYSPFLMYASANWQNTEIQYALEKEREAGNFLIPDDKLIMYEDFTDKDGQKKPIIDTADQIEGLHFPPFEGKNPPRRVTMVSHPAHLMRILHIMGKYPDGISEETILQLFPVPTPKSAGDQYTRAEISGTLAYIFKKGRATLEPFTRFEI